MNLQEIRTFLTIVDTGSLVRASQVLNVTQSTVTTRLKSLEDQLGQTLINRNKSGATMTAAGVRLHRYADTIVDLWRQAQHETSLPDGMSGVCNLACEFDLWPDLGDRLLDAIADASPEIAISVWLGSQGDVASWLDQGKSDICITYRSSVSQRQGQISLDRDDLVLVSSRPDAPVRFDPDYVYIEAGEAFGRDHATAFADANTARISFGNASVGLEHLLKTGGSGYLPRRMVQRSLHAGKLHLIQDAPQFQRDIFLSFNTAARAQWGWFDQALDRAGLVALKQRNS